MENLELAKRALLKRALLNEVVRRAEELDLEKVSGGTSMAKGSHKRIKPNPLAGMTRSRFGEGQESIFEKLSDDDLKVVAGGMVAGPRERRYLKRNGGNLNYAGPRFLPKRKLMGMTERGPKTSRRTYPRPEEY